MSEALTDLTPTADLEPDWTLEVATASAAHDRGASKETRATVRKLWRSYCDLRETLEFYGNPETYHACAFLFDRPTGGWDEDFAPQREHRHPDYDRYMPGKAARRALRKTR